MKAPLNALRRGVGRWTLAGVTVLLTAAPAAAAELTYPAQQHGWAKFATGSWKQVRVVSETLDDGGRVASSSTTDTKTILTAAKADRFTLRVEASVEVGGKPFKADSVDTQGLFGESGSEKATVRSLGEEKVTIEEKAYTCQVWQVEVAGANQKRSIKVFYNPDQAPYILRQEATATDAEGKETLYRTTFEVLALNMPCKVGAEILPAAYVRQIHKNHKSSTVTLAVHSKDVPGEVVAYSAKETDLTGKVIRRRTLELLDYGVVHEPDNRVEVGGRLRNRIEKRKGRRE